MKKIAKISLVAAVAVAGLTTANAQQLEDAIKKVEVTGSVVYRYNDYNNDTNTTSTKTTGTGGASNQVDTKNNGTLATQDNNYKAAMGVAAPVNDFVKLNTRFLVANENGDFAGPLETSDGGDANVDVELSNAYFSYTGIKNTTVNVGKQGLTTPWTVATQIDGNEQTGTGALALSTVGPVTLAAAYFNQTNLGTSGNGLPGLLNAKKPTITDIADEYGYDVKSKDAKVAKEALAEFNSDYTKDERSMVLNDRIAAWNSTNAGNANFIGSLDVAAVGTIVAAGPVTLDAWYADLQDTFSTYTLGAKTSTTLGGLKLGADARYTTLELDRNVAEAIYFGGVSADQIDTSHNYSSNIHDDNSLAKLTITADYSIFNSKVAYGKTGKEGGLTALDNDASTTLLGWGVTANGKADADFYQLVAGVNILDNLNLSGNYVNVDYTGSDSVTKNVNNNVTGWTKESVEEEEIYAQLTYKMSKNLTAYTRYGVYAKDTATHTGNVENPSEKGSTKYDSRNDTIDETRGRIQVAYTF